MVNRFLITVLIGSLFSTSALAASVQDWVSKMNSSSHQGNYQGTFVFWRDQKLEAMHVVHGSQDGQVWVGLESLNGESRRLIHQNGEVTAIFPDKRLVSISQMTSNLPFHPELPKDIKQLDGFYQLKVLGEDRVANRKTQIIQLKPRDTFRYGFKYWLDKETGLMLRCDVINQKEKVLGHMMFTEFEYLKKSPQRAFKYSNIPENYRVVKQARPPQVIKESERWFSNQLPKGFVLTKSILKPMRKKQDSVRQLIFSDGLASVSVFIDQNAAAPHRLNGHTSMGAINAYGVMRGQYQVTAIGEVPLVTVRLIAKSIQHRQ